MPRGAYPVSRGACTEAQWLWAQAWAWLSRTQLSPPSF